VTVAFNALFHEKSFSMFHIEHNRLTFLHKMCQNRRDLKEKTPEGLAGVFLYCILGN
jgi:hypothetical protein